MSSTRRLLLFFTLFSVSNIVLSASFGPLAGRDDHDHDHAPLRKRLPSTSWYQRDDHPVHNLFKRGKRDTTSDGTNYAEVGSAAWSAGYPEGKPDVTQLPQEWVDALNAAVAAGKIPNIPPSTPTGGNPTYGSLDPMSDEVCSTTYKCRKNDWIWDAPEGVFGAGFDDGPLPTSDPLYDFLQQNDIPSTHFMIGINVLQNPKEFTTAFETLGDDIAVHTWTHPYMTTKTNEELLGEFGWTMEIIHNSTGGRLPKYWRPPYGDSDNRVGAIAKEVFGLQTILWNQDTEDWSMGEPGSQATPESVQAALTKWIEGPKNPGLIILEHELSNYTVDAFIQAYPLLKSNGWNVVSACQLDGGSAYQNADGDDGTVTHVSSVLADNEPPASNSSAAAPTSTPTSTGSSVGGASSHSGTSTKQTTATAKSASVSSAATGATQSSAATSMRWHAAVPNTLAAGLVLFVSAVVFA